MKNGHTVTAVAAIIISIISLSWTIYNDSKLEELSYDNRGLRHRPRIVLEKPETFNFSMSAIFPGTIEALEDPKRENPKAEITVSANIKGTNKSEAVAKIVAEAIMDTPTGLSELREMLLDEEKRKGLNFRPTKDYYHSIEVLPNEEHQFDFSRTIKAADLEKQECVVHYMVLYENEAGNLYDSYMWMRFNFKKTLPFQYATKDWVNVKPIIDENEVTQAIKHKDSHFSTHMYSKDSAEIIWDLAEEYTDKFKKEMENK